MCNKVQKQRDLSEQFRTYVNSFTVNQYFITVIAYKFVTNLSFMLAVSVIPYLHPVTHFSIPPPWYSNFSQRKNDIFHCRCKTQMCAGNQILYNPQNIPQLGGHVSRCHIGVNKRVISHPTSSFSFRVPTTITSCNG